MGAPEFRPTAATPGRSVGEPHAQHDRHDHLNIGSGVRRSSRPLVSGHHRAVNINGNSGGASRINLYGASAPQVSHGVTLLNHAGSTVSNMVINGWSGYGILLKGGGGHTVVQDLIGTNYLGTVAFPNTTGIYMEASDGNTIGDTTNTPSNLLAGNIADGIQLDGDSDNNVIEGNFVGTDLAGTGDLGNGFPGIDVQGVNNVVGVAGAGNVVGNSGEIGINAGGSGTKVQGNFVGTDMTGIVPMPNKGGIRIPGGENIMIGGAGDGEGNVINSNAEVGLRINGGAGHRVLNNVIGTNVAQTLVRGNLGVGIEVNGFEADVHIGEALEGTYRQQLRRNLHQRERHANSVAGNSIGVTAGGTVMSNNDFGVLVEGPGTQSAGPTLGLQSIKGHGIAGVYLHNARPHETGDRQHHRRWAGRGYQIGVLVINAPNNQIGTERELHLRQHGVRHRHPGGRQQGAGQRHRQVRRSAVRERKLQRERGGNNNLIGGPASAQRD